jgi:hypothetical protein
MKADVDRQHAEAAAKDREDHFARGSKPFAGRLGERYRPGHRPEHPETDQQVAGSCRIGSGTRGARQDCAHR